MSHLVQDSAASFSFLMPRCSILRLHMRSTWHGHGLVCLVMRTSMGALVSEHHPPTSRLPFGVVRVRMELDLSFVASIAPR